ncbi:hypothetical protein HF1_01430 [Mycoplasma haemofelis str. Langford 1]|uniref:Uncharacterized protein n=1 Tax=Mycoplasma haemofelis (strain Langford 1) TaxID=941640 RepID=E8ZKI5_MYCHL|nr:hypothetical protein HF1_01430 [Mycoplasma haemofelis str. Langford 1]
MLRKATITKEELKSWCSNTRVESSEDQELLDNYESWCTKNSVFGQLKELKKEALGENDPKWDTNVSSYLQSGNENKKLTDDNGNAKSDHTLKDKKELIDWCKRNLTTLYKQGSATTEAYIQWCTKDIANAEATPTPASEA